MSKRCERWNNEGGKAVNCGGMRIMRNPGVVPHGYLRLLATSRVCTSVSWLDLARDKRSESVPFFFPIAFTLPQFSLQIQEVSGEAFHSM